MLNEQIIERAKEVGIVPLQFISTANLVATDDPWIFRVEGVELDPSYEPAIEELCEEDGLYHKWHFEVLDQDNQIVELFHELYMDNDPVRVNPKYK
jgi:hypothetical protein